MTDPKQKLLDSLTFLDETFQTSTEYIPIADDANVESVDESSLSLEGAGMEHFFRVPLLRDAGLSVRNSHAVSSETFYKRDEVVLLLNSINNLQGKNVLFVQGQPGTGKSTVVWRTVLERAISGDNILWTSLDRAGLPVSTIYFQGKCYFNFGSDLKRNQILTCLFRPQQIPLDTVVVDGCSTATKEFTNEVRRWAKHSRTGPKCRAIFTDSTKVERLRNHQHDDVFYHVVPSWTPDEFERSLIHDDETTTPLFDACASLFYDEYGIDASLLADSDDDEDDGKPSADVDEDGDTDMDSIRPNDASVSDSLIVHKKPDSRAAKKMKQLSRSEILEAVSSRYSYCGGSARWMFNYTKKEVEKELRTFCKSVENRQGILDGNIGPTSNAATSYFFGSSRMANGETEYFLVSKRAVEILTEEAGASSYEALYLFADKLENPAFEGWIVEADLFSQLESARKQSADFIPGFITLHCAKFNKPEAIHTWEHTKNKNRVQVLKSTNAKSRTKKKEFERIQKIATNLVPQTTGKSIVCKPTAWNQGGYDVFFVEFLGDARICLRFGQVTKGQSHSLKGGYMFSVIQFFQEAGYAVDLVEIAFLLTPKNVGTFALGEVEGTDFLQQYGLFGEMPVKKWQSSQDIAKYELRLSRTDTAANT